MNLEVATRSDLAEIQWQKIETEIVKRCNILQPPVLGVCSALGPRLENQK
jgi:hypothetical protein